MGVSCTCFKGVEENVSFERLAAGPEPPGNPSGLCFSFLLSTTDSSSTRRKLQAATLASSTPPPCQAVVRGVLGFWEKEKKTAAAAQGYTLGLHDLLIARQRWKLREACTGKRCFVGCMCVLVRFGQLLPAGDLSDFNQVGSSFLIVLLCWQNPHNCTSFKVLSYYNLQAQRDERTSSCVIGHYFWHHRCFIVLFFLYHEQIFFLLNHHVCGWLLAAQPSTCARVLTNY